MSKLCLDFLRNSFLFDNAHADNNYSAHSDSEIKKELKRYREFVLEHSNDIRKKIAMHNRLNVSIESFGNLPTEELYRQLILYIDEVVIPDPLFKMTEERQPISDIMSDILGFGPSSGLNRKKLTDALNYIKCIYPLIEAEFVIMLPITVIHETPKEIPLKYSPTAFSEVLPKNIINFYRSVVKVNNIEKKGNNMIISPDDLKCGTKIAVRFPDGDHAQTMMYHYWENRILNYDEATRRAELCMRPAETISQTKFDAWVNQSINQAAIHHFIEKYSELIFAQSNGCMFLTRSELTAKIINMAIDGKSKESDLASLAMKLNLPVLDKLPLTDIIDIRQNYGEAFHNFRTALNSKLNTISAENEQELKQQLDDISYELASVQVAEVKKEYRKLAKLLKWDAIALAGSLIASFATGGLTAIGAVASFIKGTADAAKYYNNVHEHNGFLLWQLTKRAEKITV